MHIEGPNDENNLDSIQISYPGNTRPASSKNPQNKKATEALKNIEMQKAIKKFKKNSSIDVAQTLFYYQTEFNMKIRDRIISNLRSVEYKSKRFFLYLIVFRPENIYELNQSFFFFEKDIPINDAYENETKFTIYNIKACSKFDEYITELGKIKTEMLKLKKEEPHRIVMYFEQIFVLSAEELEKLVFLLNEEIVEDFPSFRFNFLVNIIEKYQFTFRLKNLYVERVDFIAKNSLFYKALMKMVKASILPSPVFAPEFLQKIDRNFKDYCVTLMVEANKWSVYKELQYVLNYNEIEKILNNGEFVKKAREHNTKFLIGLKILKLIGRNFIKTVPDFLHEWMLSVLTSPMQKIDFSQFNNNCQANINDFNEKIVKLRERIKEREITGGNEILNFFDKVISEIQDFKEEVKTGRSKNDKGKIDTINGNLASRDKMNELVLKNSKNFRPFVASLGKLFVELNNGIQLMVYDYFDFVKIKAKALFISNFAQIESFVNPDIVGNIYQAFENFPSEKIPLYSAKIFFDILKGKPTSNNAVVILEEFTKQIQEKIEEVDLKEMANGKGSQKSKVELLDLFMYNQQLFEHLKMINLSHANVYKLEKLFFAKYNLLKQQNK